MLVAKVPECFVFKAYLSQSNCSTTLPQPEQYTVPPLPEPRRLSDICAGWFEAIPSRKGMKKAIDRGWVRVNGEMADTGRWMHGGESVELHRPEVSNKPPFALQLDVLFEDEYLAVVVKPAGIAVSGNQRRTLENALVGNFAPSAMPDALLRPEPVHRLDFPTSGALLVAKTQKTLAALNKMFEDRQVEKHYAAVVAGSVHPEGEVHLPIADKLAHSSYEVLRSVDSKRFGQLHLLRLVPHTGRRHQLRIHMASLGCPILGDVQYAGENTLRGKGLFLHSEMLRFVHPVNGKVIEVRAKLPAKFERLIRQK